MRFILIFILMLLMVFGSMLYGTVDIPPADVLKVLTGSDSVDQVYRIIVLESRLPMAFTALFAGASLSVAGLMLQTTFQNPLAGPSILGVSSGASLGVAVVMLSGGTLVAVPGVLQYISTIVGAIIGAGIVILFLLLFSSVLRGAAHLLIAGIMIGYIASSVISLLNYFAPAEGVKSYVVWGLGSFGGVSVRELPVVLVSSGILLLLSLMFAKPLNALLLGERYAANMGYSVRRLRTLLLSVAGLLTAVITAFCGPIGFIGLAVPHIARMIFKTSNHIILIPATILCGGTLALMCSVLTVIPATTGVMPINAVTPFAGVPVILYILVNRRKIRYFN